MIESLRPRTTDGLGLEAELATPDRPSHAAMVICHPHPRFGGTMRTVVVDDGA